MKIFFGSKKGFKSGLGFTLIEVIVTITLIAILGTISLSMFFATNRSISFFATFTNIQSTIQNARNYASNMNPAGNMGVPDRYGIYFESNSSTFDFVLFADNGDTAFLKDASDTIFEDKSFSIDNTKYSLEIYSRMDSVSDFVKGGAFEFTDNYPASIFFEKDSADFSVLYTDGSDPIPDALLPKTSANYVVIELQEIESGKVRYLVINQVSGLAEEMDSLTNS